MTDLLELSARIIDSGVVEHGFNPTSGKLYEIADRIAMVPSFSHAVAFRTEAGLAVFDASSVWTGETVVNELRSWSAEPVDTIFYTHGHFDHVGGAGSFVADAFKRGYRRPRFVAQEKVRERFARYRSTNGWNLRVNSRQFSEVGWFTFSGSERFLPDDVPDPEVNFQERLRLDVGGEVIELHHARGETDDHLWAWIPSVQAVCCGDLLIPRFPNAGNPQKVQRYPGEWAAALREIVSYGPQLLLPAHGLPISGKGRIARLLDDVAGALEYLVSAVVEMMNSGSTLDEIVHSVKLPEASLAKPYLYPLYDEPEFVVHNIWRLYGGWWDGNPARLKPPPDSQLASEVAALAGGAGVLARQALATADLRLACQLAEWAVQADPKCSEAHAARAKVYGDRRKTETSLMTRAIFAEAAEQSTHLARE